jgi:hypothetical protein
VEVRVVLPCAGSGSRLGLPFPKELAPLGPGRCVIDSSLDLIRNAAADCDLSVLLMTDGERDLTVRYARARLPWIGVAEARQDPRIAEWSGAVMALGSLLGDVNVLLLPDVLYSWAGDPVTELADAAAGHGFAVAAVKAGPEQITTAGALRIEDGRIAAHEDKPVDPEGYDALWGMLGFTRDGDGPAAMRLLSASITRKHDGPVTEPPLAGAPVTWLDGFTDCGTWDRYYDAFSSHVDRQ